MRRIISIAMPLLMILSIVTGIAESQPSHTGKPVLHIAIVILFAVAACAHAWVNRKVLAKYLFGSKKG
ncbi:MAG: hypothetical protein PHO26_04205 [Dehalococcoidia bacterium]|nr:hypothetical protein [Dehalococcoidia bacterium]MDD5493174.1 hypothetical protein [Dehalococcoidia bacterium]